MKIIITATSNSIDQEFNPRFGRCEYFIQFDSETKAWQVFDNPGANASGGAGPLAVQFIADKGAQAVISGRYGPSAFSALEAAGIPAYVAEHGSVREVLEQFLADELEIVNAPTGEGFHGGNPRQK